MDSKDIKAKAKVLRCPNCGASDAVFDINAGGLRCLHCREVFLGPKVNEFGGVEEIVGEIRSEGAKNIVPEDFAVTFRCPSCGANVMASKEVAEVHCHWCRHNLSSAEKIPNGMIPDMILPFKVKRAAAFKRMLQFSKERRFMAYGRFHRRLKEENIQGVYLPYMVTDIRVKATVATHVGITLDQPTGKFTALGLGRRKLKLIRREYEVYIDDLTAEAAKSKVNNRSSVNTNYVINSILPFDTEEAVEWDPRYMKGFSFEKRDMDVDILDSRFNEEVRDIVTHRLEEEAFKDNEKVTINVEEIHHIGHKWKTAYLPVWLYSCPGDRILGGRKIHYIAMNARTGEMMGSVPINDARWQIAIIVPIVVMVLLLFFGPNLGLNIKQLTAFFIILLLATIGIERFICNRSVDYVNAHARHDYERDTRVTIKKLGEKEEIAKDDYIPSNRTAIISEDGTTSYIVTEPWMRVEEKIDEEPDVLDFFPKVLRAAIIIMIIASLIAILLIQ